MRDRPFKYKKKAPFVGQRFIKYDMERHAGIHNRWAPNTARQIASMWKIAFMGYRDFWNGVEE